MKKITLLLFSTLLLFGSPAHGRLSHPQINDWQDKIDPWVQSEIVQGETEFLVLLTAQADLSGASLISGKQAKGAFVYQQLSKTAARTQKPLLVYLESIGVAHRPFWIANMIWVRAGQDVVQQLARRQDVSRITANPAVRQGFFPTNPAPAPLLQQTAAVEWNLSKVRAPEVWNAGFSGQNVVIAGQDTGYQWDHPALKNNYRGWDGASADHNYNWHDAIHPPSGGGICGTDSPFPCDDQEHGTHTMGTMIGDDGSGNQVGMAPGARWIGCRNMDRGFGTPATYAECYQWFVAPTDLSGNNPRPDLAPDVINNSWSCLVSEGCTDPNILLTVVENVRMAGILTVQAASNVGPSCSTVNSPAAIYDASFTVGATDSTDNIASFSSRGPVVVDGSYRLKPDVSAPGVFIRSSIPTSSGTYGYSSGTSMASPHVAGLAALMISADPGLSAQVDQIERLISHNTLPQTTSQNCGGIPGSQIPNNTYGWGRIDSWLAVTNFDIQLSASPSFIQPGGLINYTLVITQRYPSSVTNVHLTQRIPENTTFVSASPPFMMNGGLIIWSLPTMEPGGILSVQLTVQAPPSGMWVIKNQDYAVFSDQTPSSPLVDANLVFVADYFNYFPFAPRH